MAREPKTPADLVRRVAAKRGKGRADDSSRGRDDGWRRQTYRLPRTEAQATAREWFDRYPKAAYMTEVESWCVLDDGLIEFTMRRLPSAD
ncbi:MAG TPA: hypothetical protein VHK66_02385 [Microvirga sp.]|jgi:hypothetical protein|nr:hypothetical protein [Microvirga sp.]